MGYFSRLEVTEAEHAEPMIDLVEDNLTQRLEVLWDQLAVLSWCCNDPEIYERYFYSDHIPEPYELPNTIQDVLCLISTLSQQLTEHREQKQRYDRWLEVVRSTGATPDGQIVLSACVFPLLHLKMQAA